jgi:Icc protein
MRTVRLVQITDTHLSGDERASLRDVATLPALRAVLVHAAPAIEAADAVLVTGDVVQDDPRGYRHFREVMGALGRPVLVLPGNHDDPAALRDALHDHPAFQLGGHFDVGGWRIVLLDSVVPGEVWGRLDATALADLERRLGEAPDRHTLVCLHHHPVSMSSGWLEDIGLRDPAAFLALIRRHAQARGVVWGHVHQAYDAVQHGVRLLATPSTCVQFRPRVDDFEIDSRPPGYRMLALQAHGGIDTEVAWLDDFSLAGSSWPARSCPAA